MAGEATTGAPATEAPTTETKPATDGKPPEAGKPGEAPKVEAKAPEAPPPRKHKVEDKEYTDAELVDLWKAALGDQGLSHGSTIAAAARRKLSEAGQITKEMRDAWENDLGSPGRLMSLLTKRLGSREKARALMEEAYAADVEERNLSDEERRKRSAKSEVEELEAKRDRLRAEEAERQRAQAAAQLQPEFGRIFSQALTAAGLDPKADPRLIAEMAKHVEQELPYIKTRADLDAVVAEVARAFAAEDETTVEPRLKRLPAEKRSALLRTLVASMPPEDVAAILGDDGMRKLRAYDVARVEAAQRQGQQPKAPAKAAEQPSNGAPKPKRSVDDWLKDRF